MDFCQWNGGEWLSLVGSALPWVLCPPFGVGGRFFGCCLSALQVVASPLSALSQLQGGGGFSLDVLPQSEEGGSSL